MVALRVGLLLTLLVTASVAGADECSYGEVSLIEEAVTPSPKLISILDKVRRKGSFSLPYEQVKTIAVLKKPLLSAGKFHLREGQEIEFHQVKPFEQRVIINSEQMIREAEGRREVIEIRALPQGAKMAQTLLSLFSNETQRLLESLTISLGDGERGTVVLLAPRESEVQRFIKTISIEVRNRVDKITICEGNGDITKIVFGDE